MSVFKKYAPGCNCCFGDASTGDEDRGHVLLVYEPTGNGITAEVYGGAPVALDITTIGALGAGAVLVGIDAENNRWMCQRTNGEVWTIKPNGTDPQLLWATTVDTAGMSLQRARWHESWGYGFGWDGGDYFTLDANGDIVDGPYTLAGVGRGCTDASGVAYNLRQVSGVWRVLQSNVVYSNALTANGGQVFSTGVEVFCGATTGASIHGVYETPNLAAPVLEFQYTAAFPDYTPNASRIDIEQAYWNSRSTLLNIGKDVDGTLYEFRRLTLDLTTNLLLHDATSGGEFLMVAS